MVLLCAVAVTVLSTTKAVMEAPVCLQVVSMSLQTEHLCPALSVVA